MIITIIEFTVFILKMSKLCQTAFKCVQTLQNLYDITRSLLVAKIG